MITSCQLSILAGDHKAGKKRLPIDAGREANSGAVVDLNKEGVAAPEGIELLPKNKKRKTLLLKYDNTQNEYYQFVAQSNRPLDSVIVSVNEIQEFSLHFVKEVSKPDQKLDQNVYIYESERIKSRKFIGYHLGTYLLKLHYLESDGGKDRIALRNVRQDFPLLKNDLIQYMYQVVDSSEFFLLFASEHVIANTRVDFTHDSGDGGFWKKKYIMFRYLKFIDKFLNRSLTLISNSREKRSIGPSTAGQIKENDINWLSQNVNNLQKKDPAIFKHNRKVYSVARVQRSQIGLNYDTYENRLMLTCLTSIAYYLESLLEAYENSLHAPSQSVRDWLNKTNTKLEQMSTVLSLSPPFVEQLSYSHVFFNRPELREGYEFISLWFSTHHISLGKEFDAGIPVVTEIFEYYCVIKITESLQNIGFVLEFTQAKNENEMSSIFMRRFFGETITIFYEPNVTSKNKSDLPVGLTHPFDKNPDILIDYEFGKKRKIGVMDPKLTSENYIKERSEEIFAKYGLYMHSIEGESLDYIVSIYPHLTNQKILSNYRVGELSDKVLPFLGIMAIPIEDDEALNFQTELIDLIIG